MRRKTKGESGRNHRKTSIWEGGVCQRVGRVEVRKRGGKIKVMGEKHVIKAS